MPIAMENQAKEMFQLKTGGEIQLQSLKMYWHVYVKIVVNNILTLKLH